MKTDIKHRNMNFGHFIHAADVFYYVTDTVAKVRWLVVWNPERKEIFMYTLCIYLHFPVIFFHCLFT